MERSSATRSMDGEKTAPDGGIAPSAAVVMGDPDPGAYAGSWWLARDLASAGHLSEAADQMALLLDEHITAEGADNARALDLRDELADMLSRAGRHEEAFECLDLLHGEMIRLYMFHAREKLDTHRRIAETFIARGDLEQAFDCLYETILGQRGQLGRDDPSTIRSERLMSRLRADAERVGVELPDPPPPGRTAPTTDLERGDAP